MGQIEQWGIITMNTVYLDPKLVPQHLRGGYNGKQFKAVVCTEMTLPADAGLWSGGSRDVYSAIDFNTGQQTRFPGQDEAPWGNRQKHVVKLEPGFAVVEHTYFCGKDLGLTYYVHPDNAAKLLPAPVGELSEHEAIVLDATASLKSSYNGKDRYEMKREDWSYPWRKNPPFMSREQWDAAKQSLIGRGLLNKAGAITVAGRNARTKS